MNRLLKNLGVRVEEMLRHGGLYPFPVFCAHRDSEFTQHSVPCPHRLGCSRKRLFADASECPLRAYRKWISGSPLTHSEFCLVCAFPL